MSEKHRLPNAIPLGSVSLTVLTEGRSIPAVPNDGRFVAIVPEDAPYELLVSNDSGFRLLAQVFVDGRSLFGTNESDAGTFPIGCVSPPSDRFAVSPIRGDQPFPAVEAGRSVEIRLVCYREKVRPRLRSATVAERPVDSQHLAVAPSSAGGYAFVPAEFHPDTSAAPYEIAIVIRSNEAAPSSERRAA